MQLMSTKPRAEMDIDDARRRLSQAAEEAKALEDAGEGYAANAAWERYQLIADAIEAQERRARVARRLAGASSQLMLPCEFGALLGALNDAELSQVVVGGVAVNLLGYQRATRDVDVLVPASAEQGRAIGALLERLGATRPDGSTLPDVLFDGEHHIRALTQWGLIDFIPEGDGALSWEHVRAEAVADELFGVVVPCASLATIVLLKRLADRPRDREDLAALERAYGQLPSPEQLQPSGCVRALTKSLSAVRAGAERSP